MLDHVRLHNVRLGYIRLDDVEMSGVGLGKSRGLKRLTGKEEKAVRKNVMHT